MHRRTVIASGLTATATIVSGCLTSSTDSREPTFSIDAAESHLLSSHELVAVVGLTKEGTDEGTPTVRWELDMGDYTQATEQQFVIPDDVAETTVSVFLESPTKVNPEQIERSRLKLLRTGSPDSAWVEAPIRIDDSTTSTNTDSE